MSEVALPADRRFRRAHVKPARRRGRWRAGLMRVTKVVLVGIAAGYGLYRSGSAVADARVLEIDRVVVRGNARLSEGEVVAMLDGLRGENLVLTDLATWRRRLLASPWVREVALRRALPSTVEVVMSERVPIGIGRVRHELFLVDEQGVVIDQYGPQYADLDLPIIDGLIRSSGGTAAADPPRAELAARVIRALGEEPALATQLSQLDVSDVRNAAVILRGDPARLHVGTERFGARLRSYLELAAALRERVPDIDYVDLRFEGRIYVRPASARRRLARRTASP
jgi:cell division septal protein FtsQ